MKIVVTAALPQELRPVLKHVKPHKAISAGAFQMARGLYRSCEFVIVETGIGTRSAEKALVRVLDDCHPDFILSIGFAGALYEGADVGDLVMATSVALVSGTAVMKVLMPGQESLLQRIESRVSIQSGSFFTLNEWTEKKSVKLIVPPGSRFPVCEMETFPLADLAAQKGVPFVAIRSITDRAEEEIPRELLNTTDIAEGQGRYSFSKAARLLLGRPALIPAAVILGRRAGKASKKLWLAVDAITGVLS
jgi:adenosylhomocysteine nucleosidase